MQCLRAKILLEWITAQTNIFFRGFNLYMILTWDLIEFTVISPNVGH